MTQRGTAWRSRVLDGITSSRAIWLAGTVAILVHLGALGNEWALDDPPIIAQNPNVHTIGAAWRAFFSPYWPGVAGQYRPGMILSYAIDWAVSSADPTWFHAVNIVLHGVATSLFVAVLLAWVTPFAGLVAGLVFAVHPVHVEAVANVVGRAEIAVAVFLFAAILAARCYRAAAGPTRRAVWLYITLFMVVAALLSKEHAIVAVALLGLDALTTGRMNLRRNLPLYLGVLVVSLSWLVVFRHVAGDYVEGAVAPTIRSLNFGERLATMAPIQLHVVRLLVWPFELAADYNPDVLPRLTQWTAVATVGLGLSLAIVALSIATYRRHPVLTFGVWVAIITYAPTSNIVFGSGIILAERNLYLAVAAVAAAAAILVRDPRRVATHPWAAIAVLVVVAAYGEKSVSRVPIWKTTSTVVVEDFVQHSENYRGRLRLAAILRDNGRPAEAMAEALASAAIFPADPFVALSSVPHVLAMGYVGLAAAEAERAHALLPTNAGLARVATRARLGVGSGDSALALARRNLERWPTDTIAAGAYSETLDTLRAPDWARRFGRAHVARSEARLNAATGDVVGGLSLLPLAVSERGCWDVWAARRLAALLVPEAVPPLDRRLAGCRDGSFNR